MNHLAIHEIDHHIKALTQTHLSPHHLSKLLQDELATPSPTKSTDAQATLHEAIAAEIEATATRLWNTAWQHADEAALTAPAAPLDRNLQQLCKAWAYHKYHRPQDALSQASCTTGAMQTLWQHPAICTAINNTTARHLQSQNQADRSRIHQYPTCWAFVFGCLIYQLLQWNHSLTSYQLRELFGQPPAYSKALSRPPQAITPPHFRQLSHAARLLKTA